MTAEAPDQPVVPARPPGKRLVLPILAVLLLGASIALGVLYANQASRVDSLTTRVAEKEKGLTDAETKVRENTENLTKSQDALKTAQDAKVKAEADNAAFAPCQDVAKTLRRHAQAGDKGAYQATLLTLYATC